MSQQNEQLERPKPSAPDAERAVLGSMLMNPRMKDEAVALLTPDDFYVSANRIIFTALTALEGVEVDTVSAANALRMEGNLEAAGGISYISNLTVGIPQYHRIAPYVQILRDKSLKRQ